MHWLKVGREFYNLVCVTKIDYSFEDRESRLLVHIYSDLAGRPLQLEGRQAALFLDNISRLEGCWAFRYPDEDIRKIQAILEGKTFTEPDAKGESTVISYSPGEEKGEEKLTILCVSEVAGAGNVR